MGKCQLSKDMKEGLPTSQDSIDPCGLDVELEVAGSLKSHSHPNGVGTTERHSDELREKMRTK